MVGGSDPASIPTERGRGAGAGVNVGVTGISRGGGRGGGRGGSEPASISSGRGEGVGAGTDAGAGTGGGSIVSGRGSGKGPSLVLLGKAVGDGLLLAVAWPCCERDCLGGWFCSLQSPTFSSGLAEASIIMCPIASCCIGDECKVADGTK